jgi:tRNA(fMet)-specific endonuclease VapC
MKYMLDTNICIYIIKKQPENVLAALEEFTLPLEVMAFDAEAARCYGPIGAYLEKKGTPIGSLDLMIAAHVQSLNSILVTNNTKEFSRIPKLKIEEWVHHN